MEFAPKTSAQEEALDELYAARPEDFTALRTALAATAKKSGDTEAARRITASRKPTAAAWAVNALALAGPARDELTDLGARLREAHGAMDRAAIRALTTEQRTLVDRLARTALAQGGFASPSAALRDDVVTQRRRRRREPAPGKRGAGQPVDELALLGGQRADRLAVHRTVGLPQSCTEVGQLIARQARQRQCIDHPRRHGRLAARGDPAGRFRVTALLGRRGEPRA